MICGVQCGNQGACDRCMSAATAMYGFILVWQQTVNTRRRLHDAFMVLQTLKVVMVGSRPLFQLGFQILLV